MISATRSTSATGGWVSAGGSTGRAYGCLAIRSSSRAMSRGRMTWSTFPSRAAARGMPGCRADSSSWAKVTPPTALMVWSAMTPSLPLPDRTTAADRPFWMAASDRNRRSIGMCGTVRGGRGVSVRWPSLSSIAVAGGMT